MASLSWLHGLHWYTKVYFFTFLEDRQHRRLDTHLINCKQPGCQITNWRCAVANSASSPVEQEMSTSLPSMGYRVSEKLDSLTWVVACLQTAQIVQLPVSSGRTAHMCFDTVNFENQQHTRTASTLGTFKTRLNR